MPWDMPYHILIIFQHNHWWWWHSNKRKSTKAFVLAIHPHCVRLNCLFCVTCKHKYDLSRFWKQRLVEIQRYQIISKTLYPSILLQPFRFCWRFLYIYIYTHMAAKLYFPSRKRFLQPQQGSKLRNQVMKKITYFINFHFYSFTGEQQ